MQQRTPDSEGQPRGPWHLPVMPGEVLELLRVRPDGAYCDGTVGGGGHSGMILKACAPGGRLWGLDHDPQALERCRQTLAPHGDRVTLIQAGFDQLPDLVAQGQVPPLDGILLDLGVSSHQLDCAERGFSFGRPGPLDMRMDPGGSRPTAAQLLGELSEAELTRLLGRGDVRRPRSLARAILGAGSRGELDTTADLARVIKDAAGRGPRSGRIHPATLAFQALRMAVNDELGALERFLDGFVPLLRPGGRLAVIAFHSLEDRLVKRAFARLVSPCTCPPELVQCVCQRRPQVTALTRKPLRPGDQELQQNPRSRSARLRAVEKKPAAQRADDPAEEKAP